ncbi:uncharacterized protein BJ171DRAFT_532138 [Polychytrium aggregatum]|uniref:uncharacterized protein n=1 Tax=Polychytrium aggregatum TaxID=110093 RepID=UPI0022FF43C9|nr:uncharacterized protein BJ171DRAFT_532138 [Polychytrium aggregatum]KAI9193214.1 hypothetical protein BJ171DRAFT_532138 [Polychytrium aggregatum]
MEKQFVDDQLRLLDERLRHLEILTSPHLAGLSERALEAAASQGSLLGTVQLIQNKLRSISEEKRAIGEFLHQYTELRSLLESKLPAAESNASETREVEVKRELVLNAEEEWAELEHQLKEIEFLHTELDNPLLKDLDKLLPQLAPLEARYALQTETATRIHTQYLIIMDTYNKFVHTLSEVFVWYQEMLTTLELRVLKAEEQKKLEGH